MNIVETFELTKIFEKAEIRRARNPLDSLKRGLGAIFKIKREYITAVDHVSIRVNEGEIFGILGPNGAGKTTFLKLLATILLPDSGTALINGHDIITDTEGAKGCVSIAATGTWIRLFWLLSVRENLQYFATLQALPSRLVKQRVEEVLQLLKLEERGDDLPGDLSSGMRQKLCLSLGLLVKTPLVLLDEPTVGLDPLVTRDIRAFIRQTMCERGQTIILSTHDVYEAEELCDRVAILDHGRLIACDTPKKLKKMVGLKTVLEIKAVNLSPAIIKDMSKSCNVEKVGYTWADKTIGKVVLKVHSHDVEKDLPMILKYFEKHYVKVAEAKYSEPTLEDVFIKLTGGGEIE